MNKLLLIAMGIGLSVLSLACGTGEARATDEPRPNFLLIVADDMTYTDLGFLGHPDLKTPHLDKLRAQGMYLDQMYTPATTCSPSRHALYTGLYSMRSGAYPNHTRAYNGTKSLFTYLKKDGYRVALARKSHVGPAGTFPYEYLGEKKTPGNRKNGDAMPEVSEFINRDKAQPWFLVYASNEPHSPWTKGPQNLYDPAKIKIPAYLHDNKLTRENLATYYAEIGALDAQVGKLTKILKDSQIDKHTVVMFVSEQGSSFPYGGKWSLYDNGIRVSTIVRWPGKIKPNSKSDAMLQYVDVPPTFLEIAKIDPAKINTGCKDAEGNVGFDGRSFLNVLLGKTNKHRELVFSQQTTVGINGYKAPYPMRAVRDKRYKLIWNIAPENTYSISGIHTNKVLKSWQEDAVGNKELQAKIDWLFSRPEFELYDMEKDPAELHNVAEAPELNGEKKRLLKELKAWMSQQGDKGLETENLAKTRQGRRKKK